MYTYKILVKASKRNIHITDEIKDAVINCINIANNKPNANRRRYTFSFEGINEDNTGMIIKLTSASVVSPTRSLSSVSNEIVKNYPEITKQIAYNKNIFRSKEISSENEDFSNMQPLEITGTVNEIFFGRHTKADKLIAEKYQDEIFKIVRKYKIETTTKD